MGTRLKNLREDHDLTQKQLSEYLSVSQVAYSYYELSRRSIPVEVLNKLSDYYNTSIDYILYKTNISKPYPKKSKVKSITNNIDIEQSMQTEAEKEKATIEL